MDLEPYKMEGKEQSVHRPLITDQSAAYKDKQLDCSEEWVIVAIYDTLWYY